MRPWAALRSPAAYWRYRCLIRDGFRFVNISTPGRIGHLCVEVDALLKDTLMQGGDPKKLILVDLKDGFANRAMVDYYRKYLTVVDDYAFHRLIRKCKDAKSVVQTHPYAVAVKKTAKAYETNAKWGNRAPLFELTHEDRGALKTYLRKTGVPENAWYVCLHAREGGYSPHDEAWQGFRSVDVHSFSQAADEIARRGGWVIRMGDPTMRPYSPQTRVIDYALSPAKTAQLDIALTAGCRFFLGCASGLSNVALVFGRPCVIVHVAPIACAYGMGPNDLAIFQRLRDREGRLLPISQVMMDECADYRGANQFAARGFENVPNAPEEIREVTIEMFERLDGAISYSDDDERIQVEFRSYFREGHYSYGAASRIGRDFLRRHMQPRAVYVSHEAG
jgi:putative glycosyltransferase (TIGR04372 family)